MKVSRRQFLIGAGVSGVALSGLGGLGYWATRQPALEFIERQYGPATAGETVLVAYASQYGSTSGLADVIAQGLHRAGTPTEVRRVEHVTDLTPYRAVIIGAPIISDEWMPAAVSFVEQHRATLAALPTAYFLTCMTLALSQDEAQRAGPVKVLEAVQARIPEVRPVERGLFAGALDYSKMAPAMQQLYRLFSENDTAGDFRDFRTVSAWADAVRPRLLA